MVLIRNYQDLDYEDVRFNLQESGLFIPNWDTRDRLRKKIEDHSGSIIVAEKEKQVVGNVFLTSDFWCALIFHLSVRKDCQNLGVENLLMDEAEKRFKQIGADSIFLLAENNQAGLEEFYKKRDYFPAGNYIGFAKRL